MNTIRAFALSLLISLVGLSVSASHCRASTESQLAMAVRHRNLPQVLNLLAEGADVNARDEGVEQTPLMRAAIVGEPQIIEVLLAHDADVNAQDDEGNTALMLAASQGAVRIVQLLLQHGAIPNNRNAEGSTALMLAHRKRHATVARLLTRSIARVPGSRREGQQSL